MASADRPHCDAVQVRAEAPPPNASLTLSCPQVSREAKHKNGKPEKPWMGLLLQPKILVADSVGGPRHSELPMQPRLYGAETWMPGTYAKTQPRALARDDVNAMSSCADRRREHSSWGAP